MDGRTNAERVMNMKVGVYEYVRKKVLKVHNTVMLRNHFKKVSEYVIFICTHCKDRT